MYEDFLCYLYWLSLYYGIHVYIIQCFSPRYCYAFKWRDYCIVIY